jgi:D-glycero-D-manno-heptose 1,7-bisphosphate phosphatase
VNPTAIIFDRDDVLIRDIGYTWRIEDLEFLPGVIDALKMCTDKGYQNFVATNQGGIALGHYTEAQMVKFHDDMQMRLKAGGTQITDFAFCPHHPRSPDPNQRSCLCRKPLPGMLIDLAERHKFNLQKSVMIGDRQSDLDAAAAAGCKGYFFKGGRLDVLTGQILAELDKSSP